MLIRRVHIYLVVVCSSVEFFFFICWRTFIRLSFLHSNLDHSSFSFVFGGFVCRVLFLSNFIFLILFKQILKVIKRTLVTNKLGFKCKRKQVPFSSLLWWLWFFAHYYFFLFHFTRYSFILTSFNLVASRVSITFFEFLSTLFFIR